MKYRNIFQRGVCAVEIVLIFATFVVFVGVGRVLYENYPLGQQEITANQYQELSEVAKQSCSGGTYLKVQSLIGPIRISEFWDIQRELKLRADIQARDNARSAIMNTTPACS
jgi:hypothetical protein